MKDGIHPQYNMNATVACACGNTFTTGSTVAEMNTEVCSNCHPFYTGKQKLLDAAGSIDKFKKRTATAAQTVVKVKKERKARAKK